MTELPTCRFRSEEFAGASDSIVHLCRHPMIRGRQPFETVSPRFCAQCSWPKWDATDRLIAYRQQVDLAPTEDEHAARVGTCNVCPDRIGNYCPHAGGSCTLAQKLTYGDFVCPIGKFRAIERER